VPAERGRAALDTSDPRSIEAIARFIEREIGGLDVLVNNAAILLDEGKNIVDVEPQELEETWRVNTLGPGERPRVACCKLGGRFSALNYRPKIASTPASTNSSFARGNLLTRSSSNSLSTVMI
jgi:NAD(P)-dependent dehydrogenase (short-subunit alcohol dehydrogenase family)